MEGGLGYQVVAWVAKWPDEGEESVYSKQAGVKYSGDRAAKWTWVMS
jgi:hypothetical protein